MNTRQKLLLLAGCLLIPPIDAGVGVLGKLYARWARAIDPNVDLDPECIFCCTSKQRRRGGLNREAVRRISIATGFSIMIPESWHLDYHVEDLDEEDLQEKAEFDAWVKEREDRLKENSVTSCPK